MAKSQPSKSVSFWKEQISIYEREFAKWEGRSKKIIKRFKDERENQNAAARFNILWSNVQTLSPALYAKNPIPNIDRRFQDDDKAGTTAARVLERTVSYFVDDDVFGSVMGQCVQDRLLPGRGVAWVRYKFEDESGEAQTTEDIEVGEEGEGTEAYSEDVIVDYVHWQDFGHTWGRTWEEVRAVWRKVYLGRAELKDRFKNGDKVPLDKEEKNGNDNVGAAKKACVYEIWDKTTRTAVWLHKGMDEVLDERPDPLGLKDFFPCPKPLFATLTNDNLIPSPDYLQYQDQANELDLLTGRIDSITKALKVAGVYDASAEGVQRLLSEGVENQLIPVQQWAVFGEKGGLKGVVDYMPMVDIVNTLTSLYEAREKVKQDLYEITGISDIIRGATKANETATAQQIKGQYASLRLDHMQKDVARFSRDLIRIMAQIIAEHFSIDTIKQISGIRLLTDAEKQQIMLQQSQPGPPGPDGQPAPPQPVPDEVQELLAEPTWEEVEQLLKDDLLRCFRISIETDSTIKADQEAEKASRIELIGSVGQFLQQAIMLPPTLQPLAAELLMFGVRGFKVSREIETTFDVAMKKVKQASEAPPPPDPEAQKMQHDMMLKDKDFQLQEKEMAMREMEMAQNASLQREKLDADKFKAKMDAKAKVAPDVAMSDPELNDGQSITPMAQTMQAMAEMLANGLQQIAMMQAEGNKAIIEAVTAPKTTQIIRDAQGKITAGVQTVQ